MNKLKSGVSFTEHLDNKYGKSGSRSRSKIDADFEVFKPGLMIQEARKFKNMTQEDLAKKSGTTKSYISRIENNGSDMRLSTLKKIINDGLGGMLKLNIDF
ncbi:MAG TPA: helix-turn-helix transcriptional regulator [Ignavibacteria bacterium]|nr:helix-turn-helix transcriptional regulator [Ignavibacteria bacterium]